MENTNKRRDFIKKLGLSMLAGMGFSRLNAADATEMLSTEQLELMNRYETWMNEFAEMTEAQSKDQYNPENNRRLMDLADQAEQFKSELQQHFKDENFARYYLRRIESLSEKIV